VGPQEAACTWAGVTGSRRVTVTRSARRVVRRGLKRRRRGPGVWARLGLGLLRPRAEVRRCNRNIHKHKASAKKPLKGITDCHGSSPDSPCPSEASPLPPTAWPISKPFGSASDPPGSSAYFLFSLTDSRMFPILFLYLILLIPPVYILISNPQS